MPRVWRLSCHSRRIDGEARLLPEWGRRGFAGPSLAKPRAYARSLADAERPSRAGRRICPAAFLLAEPGGVEGSSPGAIAFHPPSRRVPEGGLARGVARLCTAPV